MGSKYLKLKKLTVSQQAYILSSMYPDSHGKFHKNKLDWTGIIVPTPLSRLYTVNIIYRQGCNPRTYVQDPQLSLLPGKKLPHVYDQIEQRLCLYYPNCRTPQWNESMHIAKTIVPWASEWLFFYELWLATGEWLGGGIHLETQKDDPKAIT